MGTDRPCLVIMWGLFQNLSLVSNIADTTVCDNRSKFAQENNKTKKRNV
jgi:hypothetical protein